MFLPLQHSTVPASDDRAGALPKRGGRTAGDSGPSRRHRRYRETKTEKKRGRQKANEVGEKRCTTQIIMRSAPPRKSAHSWCRLHEKRTRACAFLTTCGKGAFCSTSFLNRLASPSTTLSLSSIMNGHRLVMDLHIGQNDSRTTICTVSTAKSIPDAVVADVLHVSSSEVEAGVVGRSDVIGPPVSYGGHDQETSAGRRNPTASNRRERDHHRRGRRQPGRVERRPPVVRENCHTRACGGSL